MLGALPESGALVPLVALIVLPRPLADPVWAEKVGRERWIVGPVAGRWVEAAGSITSRAKAGQAGRAACHEAQCDARSCATRRSVQPDYKAPCIKARPQLQKQRCKVKASQIEELSCCRALERARNRRTWYHRYCFDPINLFANINSTDQKELLTNPEMCLKVGVLTWNVGSKPKAGSNGFYHFDHFEEVSVLSAYQNILEHWFSPKVASRALWEINTKEYQ